MITGNRGYISGKGIISCIPPIAITPIRTTNSQFYLTVKSASTVPSLDNTGVYELTNNNVTIAQDATRGNVLSFNGTYINTNYPLPIIHTRSFWVNLTSTSSANNTLSSITRPIWFSNTNYLNFNLNYNGGATIVADSGNTIVTGTWYYYTFTYDGTTAKLYRNGILDVSWYFISAAGSTTDTIQIGAYQSANQLYGYMDNIRCYSTALTQTQIQAIYNYELANPRSFYYETGRISLTISPSITPTITSSNTVYTFTTTGQTYTISSIPTNIVVYYLVVGGGGAGGYDYGGGGGGGSVYMGSFTSNGSNITLNVGTYGAATTTTGSNGEASSLTYNSITLTAKGGYGGGKYGIAGNGSEGGSGGGSGGGGGCNSSGGGNVGGSFTNPYYNNGGSGNANSGSSAGGGGGGGGAGGLAVSNGVTSAGTGGAGIQFSISNVGINNTVYYGAGGGGGGYLPNNISAGSGGEGGGGSGGVNASTGIGNLAAIPASNATGYGCGGGGGGGLYQYGGNGSSGIVILSFAA